MWSQLVGLTVCAEECETSASCGEAITAEGMLSTHQRTVAMMVCVEVFPSDVDFDNGNILMPLKPFV